MGSIDSYNTGTLGSSSFSSVVEKRERLEIYTKYVCNTKHYFNSSNWVNFLNLYSPSRGVITEICNWFMPGSDVSVLADEKWAFWGVTFAFILFGGSSCLLLLTQIFSIDTAIYEAAKVDGASGLQIDLKITLPLLKPMIGTVAVIAANYGLLLYNEIALISGGGPDNATYSLSYYVYKTALGSERLNFARGNAAGVIQILLGILLVGTINKMFHSRKEEL